MAKTVALSQQCPMEVGLNISSGKWTLRILWLVSRGPIRFNQLQREVGAITTKTLTQQLRTLEEQGMLRRTVYPETPPRVEYTLTELGQTISPVLQALCAWGKQYQENPLRQGPPEP